MDVSRRWLVRLLLAIVLSGLLVTTGLLTLAYEPTELRAGTIEGPANGTTVVSMQGFHFQGEADPKKPARLAAVGPRDRSSGFTMARPGERPGSTTSIHCPMATYSP